MAREKNDHVVAALFDSGEAAEQAAAALAKWDEDQTMVKLGAIATIWKNEDGQVEYDRHHVLTVGEGAKSGVVAGAIILGLAGVAAPLLAVPAAIAAGTTAGAAIVGASVAAGITGTMGVASGVIQGGAIGAAAGGIINKVWGFSASDLKKYGEGLDAGKSALLVHLGAEEIEPTKAQLKTLKATEVMSYNVPEEAFRHVENTVAIAESVTEEPTTQRGQ